MASSPITSWQIDGETMETVTDFLFLGSKITVDGNCCHETKRRLLLGRKAMTNLYSVLKSREITLPTKVHSQSYGFSRSRVQMWELDHKEGRVSKNRCFWIVVLEKTLEKSLDNKEIKQSILNEINPWIFTGRTDAETPILWLPNVTTKVLHTCLTHFPWFITYHFYSQTLFLLIFQPLTECRTHYVHLCISTFLYARDAPLSSPPILGDCCSPIKTQISCPLLQSYLVQSYIFFLPQYSAHHCIMSHKHIVLEKQTSTYSSIFAWKIPWTEESGGLESMESKTVRHNSAQTQTHYVELSFFLSFPLNWRSYSQYLGKYCK